ncbi:hypothetical protein PGF_00012290 [Porphyromonas gingivalis 381]|uniref:Uncharacterized protein n=1 Tax=Porphyromonas gingivalis (strain ATCC 33277 / DSM 20709 / CIP 103683 / JCM 12257 / NCTC 11834 / 2561) TaxID=431947 RepID=B2RK74_PORG3|nr:hypothetical protein EG14_06115 [Porphyromonas gingivalis]ALJ25668.1 hypothetical protein PGF_00012290 [Porphyromonas gingivalis 381]BAG33769.1 hypothetical protein PGN_1250 [Porphyromonas gingivalis ATCC 33277]
MQENDLRIPCYCLLKEVSKSHYPLIAHKKTTRWNDFYQVWAKISAKDNKMTNKWQIPEENLWNIKKNHEYCS